MSNMKCKNQENWRNKSSWKYKKVNGEQLYL